MIFKLIQGIKLLIINPFLFLKYLKKFIIETFFSKSSMFKMPKNTQKNIKGIIFNLRFSERDVYIKQMYFDFYEIATVEFMKKILKSGDVFIDVGANIGYLTAIGASLVGQRGEVHSFEPVPLYFEDLKRLSAINPSYNIVVNKCALGDKTGKAKIDYAGHKDSGASTLVPGFLEFHRVRKQGSIEVLVARIDDYIQKNKLEKIALIKIDAEGFEFPILKGLENYFKKTKNKPPIICEITPSAYPLLECTRAQLLKYMKKYNYNAYNIMNEKFRIDITKLKEGANVVFKPLKL